MKLIELNCERFYCAFIYACQFLIEQRESINKINVFPVADGDTGDNMAATAQAIIIHSNLKPSITETAQSIADASMMGARGNSGMIFSQFFNGIAENVKHQSERLHTKAFAQTMSSAINQVREAILKPVEGTILTVMERWSNFLNNNASHTPCFNALLQESLPTVRDALAATETMLPVLEKAHVVDAGALGFTHFVQGFSDHISNPNLSINHEPSLEAFIDDHEGTVDSKKPEKRYCTEAMLMSNAIDHNALSKLLSQHGDSVVTSSNPRLSRFHVHCNAPGELFTQLQKIGSIQFPKIDDMLRQYETIHEAKHPIALVTDSSVNLPESFLDQHQVHLIPLNVHIEGHDLLDRYCIDLSEFYRRLKETKNYPTTSFPAPGKMREKLRYLSEHYKEVLVVSIAQTLSGTHDALAKVAKDFPNVHVFNSKQVSGGQGLLLKAAAEAIENGLNLHAILEQLSQQRERTRTFIVVNQFDALIRSGRVSRIAGKIAQFSGITPVIALDENGKINLAHKTFSCNKAMIKIIEDVCLMHQTTPIAEYGIVHADAQDKAQRFSELAEEAFAQPPLFIEPASTAIGLHAGQGCIGVSVLFHKN